VLPAATVAAIVVVVLVADVLHSCIFVKRAVMKSKLYSAGYYSKVWFISSLFLGPLIWFIWWHRQRLSSHSPVHLPLLSSSAPNLSPSTLAELLENEVLTAPLAAPPTGSVSLDDVPKNSPFADFVRSRVRRSDPTMRISRISRVVLGGTRMATYMDLFMQEVNSRSSNPMLRPANPADAAFEAGLGELNRVFERTCLGSSPPCNIVLAWHGTPAQHVESVCRDGPRAFRTTDGGYFGAGSYFALELEYATRYAKMQVRLSQAHRNIMFVTERSVNLRQAPSASGEFPVILFAVRVGCAYVVTPGRDYLAYDPSHPECWGFSKFYSADPTVSRALMPQYDAHFVPVKLCGLVHCVTGTSLALNTDYQAAVEGVDASEACAARVLCACIHSLTKQTVHFVFCYSGARAGRAVTIAGSARCSYLAEMLTNFVPVNKWS
jgi:hypothetical protein